MTVKVNRIVKFINNFSNTGIVANEQISYMEKASGAKIYQNRFLDGTIALLQNKKSKNLKEDTFCLIKPDGSFISKTTSNKKLNNDYKLHTSTRISRGDFSEITNDSKKEVLYNLNNGKIEEFARKDRRYTYEDDMRLKWSSRLFLYLSGNRMSKYPVTELGGSLHLSIAEKYFRANGDIIYIEKHPVF